MSRKSKSKGASWERDVAKFLSEAYNESFMRVPNSGAYVGGSNSTRKILMSDGQIRHMKGDIVPPDNWHHFNVECKNYQAFPFHRFLFNESIPLLEGWLKQLKDAADDNDVNILFIKVTRIGKFVCFESNQNFQVKRHVEYEDTDHIKWKVTDFDSFFNLNLDRFKESHQIA